MFCEYMQRHYPKSKIAEENLKSIDVYHNLASLLLGFYMGSDSDKHNRFLSFNLI